MHSGSATAKTTERATELEQKFVSRSTANTMMIANTNGGIWENAGAMALDSHSESPISALPMNEPNPMIVAMNR